MWIPHGSDKGTVLCLIKIIVSSVAFFCAVLIITGKLVFHTQFYLLCPTGKIVRGQGLVQSHTASAVCDFPVVALTNWCKFSGFKQH